VIEHGYAIVPNVIAAEEADCVLLQLIGAELNRSRAGARHILNQPSVQRVAHDARVLRLAQEVPGQGAFPFRATLFEKSANSNWLVVWHQDTALPLREKRETLGWGPWSVKEGVTYAHAPALALEQILALRVHLDDSTQENGPLRVLPGTHTRGVLTDRELQDLDSRIDSVECTVNKGGVVAMRPLIAHASSKSQSEHPRRVLHIEYTACSEFENQLQLATPVTYFSSPIFHSATD
jgi:ectoine hydroxylase-related dioxygenase (phytanoyl-CoA dioxygenase family)